MWRTFFFRPQDSGRGAHQGEGVEADQVRRSRPSGFDPNRSGSLQTLAEDRDGGYGEDSRREFVVEHVREDRCELVHAPQTHAGESRLHRGRSRHDLESESQRMGRLLGQLDDRLEHASHEEPDVVDGVAFRRVRRRLEVDIEARE